MKKPGGGRPYLSHYAKYGIAPVAQDISDFTRHVERREGLLRHLGIPPRLLAGKAILEFGPGTGENALVLARLGPRRLVLVDANPVSIEKCRETLSEHVPEETEVTFVQALAEEFEAEADFDLVLAEGFIPLQEDPAAILRSVARFTAPGGLVVTTTMDAVSYLPEVLRRFMIAALVDREAPLADQVAILKPVFAPHFAALPAMSRFPEEWIKDELQLHWGKLFSIPDAIEAVVDSHDFHASSPHFVADWRWYKALHGAERRLGGRAVAAYWHNVHALIDTRFVFEPRAEDDNRRLVALAENVFRQVRRFEREREADAPAALAAVLDELACEVEAFSPPTAESLQDFIGWIEHFERSGESAPCARFAALWGRGQQYVSLIAFAAGGAGVR